MKFLMPTLILGLVVSFGGTAFGQRADPPAGQPQSWTGTLADAACKAATPEAACAVSSSTRSYGITASDGKFVPFDETSNQKVSAQLKNATGNPGVSVSGKMQGNKIKVSKIDLTR